MEMFKPKLVPIKRSTLTVEETAEYIGVSVDMIYKMTREKAIPHFRAGRRILFKKYAIDQWIEKQMQESMEYEY
ncbi:helix-turn-helix domain-containing protein [Virgibacillus kimchii]